MTTISSADSPSWITIIITGFEPHVSVLTIDFIDLPVLEEAGVEAQRDKHHHEAKADEIDARDHMILVRGVDEVGLDTGRRCEAWTIRLVSPPGDLLKYGIKHFSIFLPRAATDWCERNQLRSSLNVRGLCSCRREKSGTREWCATPLSYKSSMGGKANCRRLGNQNQLQDQVRDTMNWECFEPPPVQPDPVP